MKRTAATNCRAAIAIALLVAGGRTDPAWAQSQQSGAPTREDIQRESATSPAARAPSRLTVEGGIERAPCPLADPGYANVTVELGSVEFNGLEEVPPEALASAWRPYAGSAVPVARLCDIRDRAATILRGMGYLAAVQLPPQRIEKGGTVHMDVMMARLTRVQVRGDAGNAAGLIERLLKQVAGDGPFNSKVAERRLLLARELPGFDIRLVLRPATDTPGAITADAIVVRQPVMADFNVQNYGSGAVGPYAGLARVQVNDLTGLGDATVLSLYNTAETKEQTVLGIGHSMAIGTNGLRLSGDFTYAWSRPDLGTTTALHSRTLIGSVRLDYPLVLRQAMQVSTGFGFDLVNQRVRFGDTPLTTDKQRTLSASIDIDARDPASIAGVGGYSIVEPRWRLAGGMEVRQGIDVLGASKPCGASLQNCLPPAVPLSRLAADPTPTILRFDGSAEFRPRPTIAFVVSTRAQYSDSVLISYEEIGAGNYTIGRGYDPGALLGDSGVGVTAELRLRSGVAHSARQFVWQPYAFYDGAWSWRNDAGPTDRNPQHIGSAGGGIRGAWRNHVRFDLTVAVPLEHVPLATRLNRTRFMFSITTRLFPWRTS